MGNEKTKTATKAAVGIVVLLLTVLGVTFRGVGCEDEADKIEGVRDGISGTATVLTEE